MNNDGAMNKMMQWIMINDILYKSPQYTLGP